MIVAALQPLQEDLLGCVVESTYNWYWLVDGLAEAGLQVYLANTATIPQYAGIKYTHDDPDARHLAHLLPLSIFNGRVYLAQARSWVARPVAATSAAGASAHHAKSESTGNDYPI